MPICLSTAHHWRKSIPAQNVWEKIFQNLWVCCSQANATAPEITKHALSHSEITQHALSHHGGVPVTHLLELQLDRFDKLLWDVDCRFLAKVHRLGDAVHSEPNHHRVSVAVNHLYTREYCDCLFTFIVCVCVTMKKSARRMASTTSDTGDTQVSSSKHNAKKITTRERGPFHQSITAILTEEKREEKQFTKPTHVAVHLFRDLDRDRSRL